MFGSLEDSGLTDWSGFRGEAGLWLQRISGRSADWAQLVAPVTGTKGEGLPRTSSTTHGRSVSLFGASSDRPLYVVEPFTGVGRGIGDGQVTDIRGRVSTVQQSTLRVHLVDDDYLVRLGMERFFETMDDIELHSVSSTGDEAIREALTHQPDVVLMETKVRNVDGVRAVREIVTRAPNVKVAMVSSVMSFDVMCDAYRAGATSYLSKHSVSSDLGAAIRMIHRGDSIFSMPPDLQRFPLPAEDFRSIEVDIIKGLPGRDRAILAALTAGRTNPQIATALQVSEATVKARIANIMLKLNADGRVQLAVLAVQAGLTSN